MGQDEPPEPAARAVHELYLVKSLVHASEILWSFHHPGEGLRLRDVMERTGFGKGMCFRLLYTLRHLGFIEKLDNNRYRLTSRHPPPADAPYRLRRAGAGQLLCPRGAREGHARRRTRAGRPHRRRQPLPAEGRAEECGAADPGRRRPGDRVPDRRGDGAGDRIEVPRGQHPADRDRHSASGRDVFRRQQLRSRADRRPASGALGQAEVERAGRRDPAARARARGFAAGGAREGRDRRHPRSAARRAGLAGRVDRRRRAVQDGAGARAQAPARDPKAERVLVGAANDSSALGAARAFQEAGRGDDCAIAGQNAEPDARAELREPRAR